MSTDLPAVRRDDTDHDYRDRAILEFSVYSGVRLSTDCRLKVSDFHQDGDEAMIRLHEKGDKRRTIGFHDAAAQAISEYIEHAGITSRPLVRPRLNPRKRKIGGPFDESRDDVLAHRKLSSAVTRSD